MSKSKRIKNLINGANNTAYIFFRFKIIPCMKLTKHEFMVSGFYKSLSELFCLNEMISVFISRLVSSKGHLNIALLSLCLQTDSSRHIN